MQSGHVTVRWSARVTAAESVGTRSAVTLSMQTAKHFVPFDERPPATFLERRMRSDAVPQGSRCACEACRVSWQLSHGEPEEIEKELRV